MICSNEDNFAMNVLFKQYQLPEIWMYLCIYTLCSLPEKPELLVIRKKTKVLCDQTNPQDSRLGTAGLRGRISFGRVG